MRARKPLQAVSQAWRTLAKTLPWGGENFAGGGENFVGGGENFGRVRHDANKGRNSAPPPQEREGPQATGKFGENFGEAKSALAFTTSQASLVVSSSTPSASSKSSHVTRSFVLSAVSSSTPSAPLYASHVTPSNSSFGIQLC